MRTFESKMMSICEEEKKLQFWNEMKHQVESNENKTDFWKRIVLWRAFQFSPVDLAVVKYLCQHGADIYSKDLVGRSVLWFAASHGSLDLVKYFVCCGYDVQNDMTAFHGAIESRSLEIVKYLCQHGADISSKDKAGRTALCLAVRQFCSLEIMKYFVEDCCINLDLINISLEAVFHSAVDKDVLDIVDYLVEHGADVNSKNSYGTTILHSAVILGEPQIVKYLINRGADVNGMSDDGRTVLHLAIEKGVLDTVKCLVEHGASVNAENNFWGTLLYFAVHKGVSDIAKYLIKQGADVNGKNTAGKTILHLAVTNSSLEIVKYLVEHGADKNGKDAGGNTVLQTAIVNGRFEIALYLVGLGFDTSTTNIEALCIDFLKMAVVNNSVGLFKRLLEVEPDVRSRRIIHFEGRQMSLLEWSIDFGHDEIATILRMSNKHHKKIQKLKKANCNQLEKVICNFEHFSEIIPY